MSSSQCADRAGPILHFRGHGPEGLRLAAILIRPQDDPPPGELRLRAGNVAAARLAEIDGLVLWRYDFTLGPDDDGYELEGRVHPVQTALEGDLRIGFVSCNGEENGDLDRDAAERNLMWDRLVVQHDHEPLALLLQGGDQIYADEATHGHPLSEDWPDRVPQNPTEAELSDLTRHLRHRFARRYMSVLTPAPCARLMAEVPTLSVWDDHDICDGWGSLKESRTRSAVGQALFRTARETYLLFQHGATEADIPDLFLDPQGRSLGWCRQLPALTLLAPDLRSERHRRRIMGDAGWQGVEAVDPPPGQTFLVSSVPLLGPRLSVIESIMMAIPRMQHYEDDLRDQWQSRAHRDEWRRMLREALRMRANGPVTAISGEIHLATRAIMDGAEGRVHQLVASGISHRAPPRAYARCLGLLAGLGEAPLPGHPIRILPLPGQTHRYTAERNFLLLERRDGRWQAIWHLEDSGRSAALDISD